jgi:hypothetical protein
MNTEPAQRSERTQQEDSVEDSRNKLREQAITAAVVQYSPN